MSSLDNPSYAEAKITDKLDLAGKQYKKMSAERPELFSKCSTSQCVIALTVSAVVLVLAVVATCLAFALEIHKLKTEMASLTSPVQQALDTITNQMDNITLQGMKSEMACLDQTLSLQQALSSRLQQLDSSNNISLQQLSETVSNLEHLLNPVSSCAALPPSSPSGYYWVRACNGSAVRVYCDMTRSCGGVTTEGWMRVAHLDMKNSSHQCPSGLKQRIDYIMSNDSNITTCVQDSPLNYCTSVMFPAANVSYSSVCGRIIAYQYGSPEAFYFYPIDSSYVDGVSLTHGTPRQHIWTFAVAEDESLSEYGGPDHSCPCIDSVVNSLYAEIPSFVGGDYFCDTGSRRDADYVFYGDDPLWDGAGCGPGSFCCDFNGPPWFHRQLPQPTNDDIEMRVCGNISPDYADTAIEMIDIYVS